MEEKENRENTQNIKDTFKYLSTQIKKVLGTYEEGPSHYRLEGLDYECMDIIEMFLIPEELEGFYKGNVIKYLFRHDQKNGLEDIKKMNDYTRWLYDLQDE